MVTRYQRLKILLSTIVCIYCLWVQIEEVALVIDKATDQRRGFVFVTFTSEDCVDKCTEKTFHEIASHQVCENVQLCLPECPRMSGFISSVP